MIVLLDGWIDQDGEHHNLSTHTLAELADWRGYKNRLRNGREMYCPDCHHGVHPYQIHKSATLGIRHNPGRRGECEYEDVYSRFPAEMSHEHKATASRIVTATRGHSGWNAEPEWTLPSGEARADVYAWHDKPMQPYQKPIVWEVQMSRQNFAETAHRTKLRAEAAEGSRTRWLTSHPDAITQTPADPKPAAPVVGMIVDKDGINVIGRAYQQIEPELVPMEITVTDAVKGLIRPTNRLVLIDWRTEDEDANPCHILVPQAALSSIKAPPPPPRPQPVMPGPVEATGCDRIPIPLQAPARQERKSPPAPVRPPTRPSRFCNAPSFAGTFSGDKCGLTTAPGEDYCWAHKESGW